MVVVVVVAAAVAVAVAVAVVVVVVVVVGGVVVVVVAVVAALHSPRSESPQSPGELTRIEVFPISEPLPGSGGHGAGSILVSNL